MFRRKMNFIVVANGKKNTFTLKSGQICKAVHTESAIPIYAIAYEKNYVTIIWGPEEVKKVLEDEDDGYKNFKCPEDSGSNKAN